MARSSDSLFRQLLDEQADRKLPPVHLWQPERTGDSHMRIDARGHWYHEGGRIHREAMVRVFSTVLRRENDRHWLVTPVEKLSIEVEDAPFVAVDMEQEGEGVEQRLLFTTNVGEHVLLDSAHPLSVRSRSLPSGAANTAPYIDVRAGLLARINQTVYYRMAELAEERGDALGVWSCGEFHRMESSDRD